MKNKIIFGSVLLALLSVMALPAVAALNPVPTTITTIEGVLGLINKAAQWLFNIVLALAVILLIYAGLIWITAGGDEDKVKNARKYLTWALVGVLVALLARGLVVLVQNFVG